jgi:hypothetical protein
MACIGRKGTIRRAINHVQRSTWWQPLRRRQKFRRGGGCAP